MKLILCLFKPAEPGISSILRSRYMGLKGSPKTSHGAPVFSKTTPQNVLKFFSE